ncbi:MAG: hypothetical protein J6A03_09970 [Lachnospiraceae bacterium]|nr:hypothetical protein [Lachnospiraceae bacterium]
MEDKKIINKLDNIEEILKMLLINSVICDDASQESIHNVLNEVRNELELLGMRNIRINNIEGNNYVFAKFKMNDLRKIREVYKVASELLGNIKLVFVFERLTTKRRQALEKSKISFYIESSGEMRIYCRG